MTISSDVAFTPTIKALQEERGSRAHCARMEERGAWKSSVTPDLAAYLREADSFYLATANAAGQPYIQHRGGPPGFLRVLDEKTLGFADFKGNRQYITTGNLADNPRAHIFVMDYLNRRRVKIWGAARVVAPSDELLGALFPAGYKARVEQVILFTVAVWDANCPQHIPRKIALESLAEGVARYEARIAELEADIARLKARV